MDVLGKPQKTFLSTLTAITMSIAYLTTIVTIISGALLAILGIWGAVIKGIILIVTSGLILPFVMMPGFLFSEFAARAMERANKTIGIIWAKLNVFYTIVIAIVWYICIMWFFVNSDYEDKVLNVVVVFWSYGVALFPWVRLSKVDQQSGNNAFSIFIVFSAQISYILAMILLFSGATFSAVVIVFGMAMFIFTLMQIFIAFRLEKKKSYVESANEICQQSYFEAEEEDKDENEEGTELAPNLSEFEAWEWGNKGISFHSLGRYQEAIECYSKVLSIDPQNVVAWSNKGCSYNLLGQYQKALECYDKALVLDPQNAGAWNNKGDSLGFLGRYREAIDCYDKSLDIDPQDADTWNNKGNSLNSLGRYQEAINCFDKALDIDPQCAAAWNNKGISLNSLGRYQEAIDCYDNALDIDPQYAKAWNNKSNSLGFLGRYQESIDCCDKALDIDPRYEAVWSNKAINLCSLGLYEEAIDCCNKALDISPQYTRTWYTKALSEEKAGRLTDAVDSYQKFIKLASSQHEFDEIIAYARQRLKELKGG